MQFEKLLGEAYALFIRMSNAYYMFHVWESVFFLHSIKQFGRNWLGALCVFVLSNCLIPSFLPMFSQSGCDNYWSVVRPCYFRSKTPFLVGNWHGPPGPLVAPQQTWPNVYCHVKVRRRTKDPGDWNNLQFLVKACVLSRSVVDWGWIWSPIVR